MTRLREQIDYVDRRNMIQTLNDEFSLYDPTYRETKAVAKVEIDELSARILAIQNNGHPLVRSEQILGEVVWLHHYTANWERLYRRIHDLRCSLKPSQLDDKDQRMLTRRPDGGFGVGTTELFSNLDATTDAVQTDTVQAGPLLFLKPLLNPGRMLAALHPLLVSDVRRMGINNREKLASLESSLLQFFNKPKLLALLHDPALWGSFKPSRIDQEVRKLKETFTDFIEQSQHPRTGYWGPWYLRDDQLVKLHDLSFTFHAIRYRDAKDIEYWPEIIETTLEIKKRDYPYGWKPSDSLSLFSNHHNMDVVALFRNGFKFVALPIKRKIAQSIFEILDWCLRHSLTPTHDDFVEVDELDTINRYYFGIMFLDAAGYWWDMPFWWDPQRQRPHDWPAPLPVATAMNAAVERLQLKGSFADDVRALLRRVIVHDTSPQSGAGGSGAGIACK